MAYTYHSLSQTLLAKQAKRLYKRTVRLKLMSYCFFFFRLIRDSYLEIALVYFYLKKPKRKASATTLKVKLYL